MRGLYTFERIVRKTKRFGQARLLKKKRLPIMACTIIFQAINELPL